MRFDEVFEYIGGAGWFQVGLLLYVVAQGMLSVDAMRMNYIGGAMEHWCKIPELIARNLSHSQQKYIGIPMTDGEYSSCRRFDLNYSNFSTEEFLTWNRSEMTDHIPEEQWLSCDAWVFDQSDYVSTIGSEWDLVCDRSWMVEMISTCYMGGWLLGCIIVGPLSDRFGRKTTVLLLFAIRCVGGFLNIYSPWYEGFAIGRFIMGLSSPNISLVLYVIIAEITSTRWRSTFGVCWNTVFSFGGAIIPAFAIFVRDYFKFEAIFIWPLPIFFVLLFILEESPRWLVSRGREKEAIKILHKIAKVNKGTDDNLPKDLHFKEEEMKRKEQANVKGGTFLDLFRTPNMRKRTLIVWLCWFTVSLIFYGLSLNAGRLAGSVYLNQFLLSIVEVPANLSVIFLIRRLGRRWCTGGATFLGGVAMLLCIPFMNNDDLEVVSTVFSILGKAFASAGFAGIYVFTAELAPTQIRNIAFGTSSMCARISGMAAPFVGGPLGDIWYGLPSITFGAFGLISGCLILLLPETLGAKLPETIAEAESFGARLPKMTDVVEVPNGKYAGSGDNKGFEYDDDDHITKDSTNL